MINFFNKTKNADGKYKRPYYSLRSVHADKVLDIAQDGPYIGTAILWKGWGGDNQCFTIIQDGPDWYIKSKQTGNFLTVEGPNDGAKVFLAPKSGQPNQKFRIDEKAGTKDHIIYTYCGKALDVLEWKKDDGARISQYTYSGEKNQLWNFCDPKNITSSSSDND